MEATRPKHKKKHSSRPKQRESSRTTKETLASEAAARDKPPSEADRPRPKPSSKPSPDAQRQDATPPVPSDLVGVVTEIAVTEDKENPAKDVDGMESESAGPTQNQTPSESCAQNENFVAENRTVAGTQNENETASGIQNGNEAEVVADSSTSLESEAHLSKVVTPPSELEQAVQDTPTVRTGQSSATPTTTGQSSATPTTTNQAGVVLEQTAESAVVTTIDTSADQNTDSVTASLVPSAPALIDFSGEMTSDPAMVRQPAVREYEVIYPKLDLNVEEEGELMEHLMPFTEEDLALLYPNPQLANNHSFVEDFVRHVTNESHELYDLLSTYLKMKQALTNALNQLRQLKTTYETHQKLVWQFEIREITETAHCGDRAKVSHNYSHRVAVFHPEEAVQVNDALKAIRELLEEDLPMKSYSSQLAKVHVDHYLYLLMHSIPNSSAIPQDAPVTNWIPHCPPGSLHTYCSHLRDSVSVLFMFERRPVRDEEFARDCRQWLSQLISVLLRVASLPDHQFLFNHLLRCPAGVGEWASPFLQIPSPLRTKEILQSDISGSSYSEAWGVGLGLHGDWGGPVLDHFITMLATLLLPIREREQFLSQLTVTVTSPDGGKSPKLQRLSTAQWTFIDEMDGEGSEETVSPLSLEESDYRAFFEQFPFSDVFRHILQFEGDSYKVEKVTSYQMMRLLAFSSCLVKLLGTAFTTLRLALYKEFSKHVGQTIRNTVSYVADYWSDYKSFRLQRGDSMSSVPLDTMATGSAHSLNRLQLEFDQFVIGSIRWILVADKLGVYQFLADMPFGSVSLRTAWKIFWNIYCKKSSKIPERGVSQPPDGQGAPSRALSLSPDHSPRSPEEIQDALKAGSHKDQFVDRLMKTYTSEAVYLLTTLVNMARARSCGQSCDSNTDKGERGFINTIVLEIFECTQVVEYARETYSKTGSHLLGSIAIVHPFVISTLLMRAETAVGSVGENVILLFKELPLHLWMPRSSDMQLIRDWLLDYQLTSSESNLARVILGGLNWGSRTHDGSNTLVLPWSLHCETGLTLCQAHCKHLPSHPGGRSYSHGSSASLVGKYTTRFTTSLAQSEFTKWAWEVVLMLKLHPHQVTSHSVQTLAPSSAEDPIEGGVVEGEGLSPPSWVTFNPISKDVTMPDLSSTTCDDLADLRDAVTNEGILAYYVALCVSDLGTDTDKFVSTGLGMLSSLIDEGYHVAVLRILGNTLPRFFSHASCLTEDNTFVQLLLSLARADNDNASFKERWVTGSVPMVTKKLSALIQTQLKRASGPMNTGGEAVVKFWLQLIMSSPNWEKERSLLLLLDSLCMAAFTRPNWTEAVEQTLLEAYQALSPLQSKRGVKSVLSSVAAMVWQDNGTPSLFNVVPHEECPWLAYYTLLAEQRFEEQEKIWRTLLSRLKRDSKVNVEGALKKSFAELKSPGNFPASHLCLYRWAGLCVSLGNSHPLYPLVWQRFFTLYLARPSPTSQTDQVSSFGPRFFSPSWAMSQVKAMKTSLSGCCRRLQQHIAALEQCNWAELVGVANPSDERRDTLKSFLPKCLKYYQTLRLWLEEPRLHGPSLYLPALPTQYDANRLTLVFQGNTALWVEFVPMWEIKAELNSLVADWVDLASYQKPLRSQAHSPLPDKDNASTRIQKRLQKSLTTAVPPPPFSYCHPPFSPHPHNLLLSKETLMMAVCEDLDFFVEQAKSFTTRINTLCLLDDEYASGLPDLYSNEPRQFHVRVPCRSRFNRSHECSLPATIVFRFEEAMSHVKWETQLKTNRTDYEVHLSALSTPVSFDLVQKVMRMEHTVAELSKMAIESGGDSASNVALQNGVALFFRSLPYMREEIRQYPPTQQFLVSCMQILGQTFIQQDPQQASNVLQLLLTEHNKSDILVPLFQPNLCPEQLVGMYNAALDLAGKEGPAVAFAVLTKFNIPGWLETHQPTAMERDQLIGHIAQGLNLCGPKPSGNQDILIEVYRRHFLHLVEYEYPFHYSRALKIVLEGTERGSLCLEVWQDLCHLITSPDCPEACTLGLQLIHDSLDLLGKSYVSLRLAAKKTAYSAISTEYVPVIGRFLRQLCYGMVTRWESVAMETEKVSQALNTCWSSTVVGFEPWMATLAQTDGANKTALYYPCEESECVLMKDMTDLFVNCLNFTHSKLQDHHTSVLSLIWTHYTSSLLHPSLPHYVMAIYHASLEALPWGSFLPDLTAMESMMRLKMDERMPTQGFVFLGRIFPLFDWKAIVEGYCIHNDPSSLLQLHIMLLQLLVMLTSEREIMDRDDTGIPQLILQAQNFHWHLLGSQVYGDVLDWLKIHCDTSSILHKGSRLSLSLRLLRAAAGYPSSSGPRQQLSEETWEKRFSLCELMVELVAAATQRKDAHNHSYSDCVSTLFQLPVDVCVHEPQECNTPHLISLMQEVLNLLNVCSSEEGRMEGLLAIMLDLFDQLPQANLIALSTITAACQSLVSHNFMTKLIEHAAQCHFRAVTPPPQHPLQLQPDPASGYGWKEVTDSLVLSDEVANSVIGYCLADCSVLLLHCLLLKELPRCSSLQDEMKVASRVLQWCTAMKPGQADEAKLLLLWSKLLHLICRQVQFGGSPGELTALLSSLAGLLTRFGEDKASEGLLGVLGLGKKSLYSHRFRLTARALGVFLQCQLPVDTSGQVQLRAIPNAPGHVKDGPAPRSQSATPICSTHATKQGEQNFQSLEALLTNKQYGHLSDHVTYAVEFISSPSHCVLNSPQLLLWLSAALFPELRYLDLLRVCHV